MTRRVICRIGLLATAAWMLTTGPALAGTSQLELLRRYQPVTVLDPLEQFTPTDVGSFVADADLQEQTAPGTYTTIDTDPNLGTLPADTRSCIDQGLFPCFRLNQAGCSPLGGIAGQACYLAGWREGPRQNVVYGRVAYRPGTVVVQYWYFWYDNLYSYNYPPDDLFWQAHEGDWEVVTVVLDRPTLRPLYAAYSQHCTGERRLWGEMERRGTHPVTHVAIGSHANLFDEGPHPIAAQCIPPAALAILQAHGLPAPVDRAGPGTAYGPASVPGVIRTGLRHPDVRRTRWLRFDGTWGEDQIFHAPPPIGTVALGSSPVSPALTALWKTPVAIVSRWPLT